MDLLIAEALNRQRDESANYFALDMKTLCRPFVEAMSKLAEHVPPYFF